MEVRSKTNTNAPGTRMSGEDFRKKKTQLMTTRVVTRGERASPRLGT